MGPRSEREQWGKAGKMGMRGYRFLVRESSDPRDRTLIIPLCKTVMGQS